MTNIRDLNRSFYTGHIKNNNQTAVKPLQDGSSASTRLADKTLSKEDYQALKKTYMQEALGQNIEPETAENAFDEFMADILDDELDDTADAPVVTAIKRLSTDDPELAVRLSEQGVQVGHLKNQSPITPGHDHEAEFEIISFDQSEDDLPNDLPQRLQDLQTKVDGQLQVSVANNLKRYWGPAELAKGHQQLAQQQSQMLAEIDMTLGEIANLPDSPAKQALLPQVQTLITQRLELNLSMQVNQALSSDAGNQKLLLKHNNQIDQTALNKLVKLQGEIDQALAGLSPDAPGYAKLQKMSQQVQAVTLAMNNPTYVAMQNKQKLDLHPASMLYRFQLHEQAVQKNIRRDVDASPEGFMMAKILEGSYDDSMAKTLNNKMIALEKLAPAEFEAGAAKIRKDLEYQLRPSVIGNPEHRNALLGMLDARILSLHTKHSLPNLQQQFQQSITQFEQLKNDYPELQWAPFSRNQPVADNLRPEYYQPPVPTSSTPSESKPAINPQQVPASRFQSIDNTLSHTKTGIKQAQNNLDQSNHLVNTSNQYVSKSGTGGSSVGQTITGQNTNTSTQNTGLKTQVNQLDQTTNSLTTEVTHAETKMWDTRLTKADQQYVTSIHKLMSEAPKGSNLHELSRCFQALQISKKGDDLAKRVDIEKLNEKISHLSQQPDVIEAFAKVKQNLVTEMGGQQAAQDMATHLRSEGFLNELFKLPPEAQTEVLQKHLKQLAFLDPELASQVSKELLTSYTVQNANYILARMPQDKLENAFNDVLGKMDSVLDKGGKATGIGVGKTVNDAFNKVLPDYERKMLARAMAALQRGSRLEIIESSDKYQAALEMQLKKMGQDPSKYQKFLGPISKSLDKIAPLTALVGLGASLSPEKVEDYFNLTSKAVTFAGEAGKILTSTRWASETWHVGQLSKMTKACEFLGPVGDAIGCIADTIGSVRDFSDGDYWGGTGKGLSAIGGGVSAGVSIAMLAGCAGPGAPFVLAGAIVVGLIGWGIDAVMGESGEETMLRQLGVLKSEP